MRPIPSSSILSVPFVPFLRQSIICLAIVWLLGGATGCTENTASSDERAVPGRTRSGRQAIYQNTKSERTRFEDITEKAGATFTHVRASTGHKYFVETMGPGCAFIDFDSDGMLDIFFVQGGPLPGYVPKGRMLPALYRQADDLAFTNVTVPARLDVQTYGMGCSVGDYDNDGFDDMYITSVLGPSHLYRNNGDGTFSDVTMFAKVDDNSDWGTSAAWLDYDRDGWLDLFVCNYVRYRSVKDDLPCYYRENIKSYCIPFAYPGQTSRLFRNRGDGSFADVTKSTGVVNRGGKALGVSVFDYNNDGWPDIFIANDTEPTCLYRNNKNGTFTEVASELGCAFGNNGIAKAGMGIDVADDMNNGHASLAVTNFAGEMLGFYRTDNRGFFHEESISSEVGRASALSLGFGIFYFDYNNDGLKDLFVANGHVQDDVHVFQNNVTYKQPPLLFRNRGDGTYEEKAKHMGFPLNQSLVARGAAWGDIDNDGRMDILVTQNNDKAFLWRNNSELDTKWLRLSLTGVNSNRNAIGAKVAVHTGKEVATYNVRSGSSYLSSSDLRVHVGLGRNDKADRIVITWPSGKETEMKDVSAGASLQLREQ